MTLPIDELRRKNRLARNTLLLSYMAGLTLAFVIPENILEYSWARWFVNLMSFIPYVDRVGKVGPIPQVAQFFAAVVFVFSWAMVPPMWRSMFPLPKEVASGPIRVRQILKIVGAILFMVALVAHAIFYPSFDTRSGQFQIGSRIGLGTYGTLICGGVPLISMLVVLYIKNWRFFVYGDMDEIIKRNSKLN